MFTKNPETVATAPGSGSSVCEVRREVQSIPNPGRIEDFASDFIARRYRLPSLLARIITELSGLGGRLS